VCDVAECPAVAATEDAACSAVAEAATDVVGVESATVAVAGATVGVGATVAVAVVASSSGTPGEDCAHATGAGATHALEEASGVDCADSERATHALEEASGVDCADSERATHALEEASAVETSACPAHPAPRRGCQACVQRNPYELLQTLPTPHRPPRGAAAAAAVAAPIRALGPKIDPFASPACPLHRRAHPSARLGC